MVWENWENIKKGVNIMLAVELVKILLSIFAIFAGMFGVMTLFDKDVRKYSNSLLMLTAIALILVFNI